MADSQTEEKTLPASRKKLRDAREKGQVARSKDLTSGVSLAGAIGYMALAGGMILTACAGMFETADTVAAGNFAAGLRAVMAAIAQAGLWTVLPLMTVGPVLVVVASMVVLKGIPFSLDPIVPRAEKINPAEGFKRLFRLRSLVEFVKSLFKMLLIGCLALIVVGGGLNPLLRMPSCGVACVAGVLRGLALPLFAGIVGVLLVVALIDVKLQHWLFLRDQKMSPSEAKRERKDMEGDPHLRRERRRIMREAVRLAGGLGLRRATVVVHDGGGTTIGLRYIMHKMPAPVVVCRARGERAAAMLAEAHEARLPSAEDASLAAGLYQVPPGHGIPENLFRPMALALARAGVV